MLVYSFLTLGLIFTLVELFFLKKVEPEVHTKEDKILVNKLVRIPYRLATSICIVLSIIFQIGA